MLRFEGMLHYIYIYIYCDAPFKPFEPDRDNSREGNSQRKLSKWQWRRIKCETKLKETRKNYCTIFCFVVVYIVTHALVLVYNCRVNNVWHFAKKDIRRSVPHFRSLFLAVNSVVGGRVVRLVMGSLFLFFSIPQ